MELDKSYLKMVVMAFREKSRCSSSSQPHLRATGRQCHMGSHSVTCHPTKVNVPSLTPAMQASTGGLNADHLFGPNADGLNADRTCSF